MTRFATVLAALTALITVAPQSALAQGADAELDAFRLGWSAGVVAYGTGDYNCGSGVGIAAGPEIRTRGPWILAAGADIFLAHPPGCTDILLMAEHDGRLVEVHGGAWLAGVPRAAVHAGRVLRGTGPSFETLVGVGIMGMRANFRRENAWQAGAWLGSSITMRRASGEGAGLRVEYGRYQVPIRYYDDDVVVHRFRQWESMLRVSVTR